MTSSIFSSTILVINLLLIVCLIFFERKNPSVTWAWVLILVFVPIVGFIIYILFGQNLTKQKMFNKKIINDKLKNEYLDMIKSHYDNTLITDKYSQLIKMNYNNGTSPYTQNNTVKPFFDGEELFSDIFNEIHNAKKFIHIEFYIFKSDYLGGKFLNLLEQKAKEGVEVKLLVDCLGNEITKKDIKGLKASGVEFAVFFESAFKYVNKRINYRNHRKIIIIDGEISYLGGFNVGDEYISRDPKIGHFRDTHIKIIGNAVNDLESRFILDWSYTVDDNLNCDYTNYFKKPTFNKNTKEHEVGLQIVSSGPDHIDEKIKNGYIKIINSAQKNVYIQTPYLAPDDCMLQCIKISALSGIDVRIMIPNNPDHVFMYWVANSYVEELLECGVKVYLYNYGFLHSKCIVSDSNVCSIGTANFDFRSFSLNFETNAFIYDKEISKKIESQFLDDITYSKEISLESFKNRNILHKFFECICRLISPLA